MKYFTYLIMLSVVGNFASVTFSAPIKIEKVFGHDNFYNQNPNPLTDHQPAHLAAIQIATDKAHEQVMNMKNMLDHEVDHPQLHDHLVNAFGPNYNKAEIKKTVDRLAGGAFDIGSTNAPNTGEYAGVAAKTSSNARTARVGITEAFHKLTPEAQAGALLHEASHAIALTKDYFGPDAHNHIDSLKSENGKTEGTKSGYAHTDLDHLKQHASDVMHKNADSYRVFGHTATHGLAKPLPPIEVKPQHPCHSKSDGKDCSLQ